MPKKTKDKDLYSYRCPKCKIEFEDEIPVLKHCLVNGCEWDKSIDGNPIEIVDELPKSYYRDFEPKKAQEAWIDIEFKRPSTECEMFEFLIRPPYFIVLGDWNPAIYKFDKSADADGLIRLARQRHSNPSFDRYLESKCDGTHNPKFWIAFEAMCLKIKKEMELEEKQKQAKHPDVCDRCVAGDKRAVCKGARSKDGTSCLNLSEK
jgi:hypothetical protein